MALTRKLKSDRSITGALIPISMFLIFGAASLAFGLSVGLIVLASYLWALALFYLYAFLRTGNLAQLVISADDLYFGFMVFVFEASIYSGKTERVEYLLAYMFGLLFFSIVMLYLVMTRKMKWRGREVFELAAAPVEETGNGYTARPKPVGKVDYSPQQVRAFARFAAKHLIALPYITSKNITLVLVKMGDEYGRLLGLSGDYYEATWVNFDADGEVSVHISQKDYLDYREPLAFDPLCTSLGQVFIAFLDTYVRGEGVRIIDRLDDLKVPVFS